ncbi:MAG: 6-phosphofructokinase [Bacteriovoracia bacterium]
MKKKKISSVAVLCSGGDAPGMNAALRSVVRTGIFHGLDVWGVYRGFSGLLEGHLEQMNLRSVANIIQRGGTIIKTARCQAFFGKTARAEAAHILRRKKVDALVVIGGDGSYAGAYQMSKENNFPVVGVPGTIDNDVFGTEYTIGFDTAVNTALESIDRIRDTASSHDRVFLVEVMGRASAEIAIRVGISGGAEVIVPPIEMNKLNVNQLVGKLKDSAHQGKLSSIIVVAEGLHPGGAQALAKKIKDTSAMECRVVILGYIQRGGVPSALDRYMASCMGSAAIETLLKGELATAISVVNGNITPIALQKIVGKKKKMNLELLKLGQILAS